MNLSSLPANSMQDERKANESIMDALEKERQQALAAQQRAMEQHLTELEAERQHQADLAAQLSQTQVLLHASAPYRTFVA